MTRAETSLCVRQEVIKCRFRSYVRLERSDRSKLPQTHHRPDEREYWSLRLDEDLQKRRYGARPFGLNLAQCADAVL